jgi:phage gpG-like protein
MSMAHIKITGLRETLRALEKAGADTGDMKELMHSIGEIVADNAEARTPRGTGRLANSYRAGRGKTKAVVRAGGARVPYAGVIEYGWPAHGIEPHMSLTSALGDSQSAVVARLEEGLEEILRKNNLK